MVDDVDVNLGIAVGADFARLGAWQGLSVIDSNLAPLDTVFVMAGQVVCGPRQCDCDTPVYEALCQEWRARGLSRPLRAHHLHPGSLTLTNASASI